MAEKKRKKDKFSDVEIRYSTSRRYPDTERNYIE